MARQRSSAAGRRPSGAVIDLMAAALGRTSPSSTRKAWREAYGRFCRLYRDASSGVAARGPARPDRSTNRGGLRGLPPQVLLGRVNCDRSRPPARRPETDLPGVDWSWLLTITKRIAAMAPRRPPKYTTGHQRAVSMPWGSSLWTKPSSAAEAAGRVSKVHAFVPRRTDHRAHGAHRAAQADAGANCGSANSSSRPAISGRSTFRRRIPKPTCAGLSNRKMNCPSVLMSIWIDSAAAFPALTSTPAPGHPIRASNVCRCHLRRCPRSAPGRHSDFPVNLHRFRHAAASFWSIQRPRQRARCQGSPWPRIIRYDRKALHHQAVARCGPRPRENSR